MCGEHTYGASVEPTGGLSEGGKQSMVKARLQPLCYCKVDIYRRLVLTQTTILAELGSSARPVVGEPVRYA